MSIFMIFAALIPAALLMYYVYSADKIEKEPAGLLVKLFLFGVLSTLSALVLEIIGQFILSLVFYPDSLLYNACLMFLVVALSEEAGKYVVVKKVAWKDPAFNYTFDGVVYAVFSSLGFAALENLMYLSDATWVTAIMRGILAVPGHAIDAVFMGSYFGAAKRCEAIGDNKGKKANLFKALAVPVIIHGFYDFCLSIGDIFPYAIIIFFIFEIFITVYAIRKVRKLSATDSAIFPMGYYPGATAAYQMFTQGVLRFDPMTGQPVYTAPVQPAMGFDPMTGQPLMQPQFQQPTGFDPMTGQPIMQQQFQQPTGFDPMTGQPIMQPQFQQSVQPQLQQPAGFDPITGQPIMQPQFQQPVQPQLQQPTGFDPITGQPIMQPQFQQPAQPQLQQPTGFDPITGQPVQPQFQQTTAPVAPVNEQPAAPVAPVIEQPAAPVAPVIEQPAAPVAPVIEQPVVSVPEQTAMKFDPMTGQPVAQSVVETRPEVLESMNATQELAPNVVSSANYDPMTGRPVEPVFNTEG